MGIVPLTGRIVRHCLATAGSKGIGYGVGRLGRVLPAVRHHRDIADLESTFGFRRHLHDRLATEPFVYLAVSEFVMRGLSTAERVRIVCDHYRFEESLIDRDTLQKVYSVDGFVLWSMVDDGETFEVRMIDAERNLFEGLSSLALFVDGICVRVASFVFVDRSFVGPGAGPMVLVTRHQRMPDTPPGAGAHLFRQHSAQYLMLAAAAGLALACDTDEFAQVRSRSHVLWEEAYAESLERTYESSFDSFDSRSDDERLTLIAAPLASSSLETVGRKHRARARKRRELWSTITDDVYTAMRHVRAGVPAAVTTLVS